MNATTKAPWWLVGGTEHCTLCLQRYAREMEVRCAACDRGVCTHCAVHVRETAEFLCTECGPARTRGDAPRSSTRHPNEV